jgi:CubicO group peptidase (beta-lactamase class C family)
MRSVSFQLLGLFLLGACSGTGQGAHSPAAPPAAARPSPPGSAPCEKDLPCQELPSARVDEAAPKVRRLPADTALRTPSGATLTAVKDWLLTERKDRLLLEDPERELRLLFCERHEADPRQAIAAAWRAFDPKFSRPVEQEKTLPPRGGWDAISRIDYEFTTKEGRVAFALAQRKGKVWYIALLEGTRAAVERRYGQLNTSMKSLKAPGVKEESFGGRKAHLLDPARLASLERFAEEGRSLLGLPGVALSVVQGGKAVLEKGFGVRELGRTAKVTPETLFLIGSNTKSMTSLLMAMLVDQGKLAWDSKVVELMPGFALGDPEATKKLAVKHTVCACTGLPRQDMEFLFEYQGATPEKRLEELSRMKPTTAFGETFQYSNPLVSAGGYMAGRVLFPKRSLGAAYDAAMESLVFQRLAMRSTTFDFKKALRVDHATPHGLTWQLRSVPLPLTDEGWLPAIRPAGGAWSNLHDMSRYVLLHLLRGKTPEGQRVVSEENLVKRYEPQVRVSDTETYGLALMVEKKHGVQIISHGGGTSGFISQMLWLPEHHVGAVILTNSNGGGLLTRALKRKLLEVLFDGRDQAQEDLEVSWKVAQEATAKEASKINFTPPRAWLARFVGTYASPALGEVAVRLEGDTAFFDAGEWKSRVGQKREVDGTLKLVLLDPPWNDLDLLPQDKQGTMTLLLETAQQKYLFTATPDNDNR